MEHLTEKIQDYIEGNLSGQELKDFEELLKHDFEFKNLVNLQKEVHLILNKRIDSSTQDLKVSLNSAEANVRKSNIKSIVKLKTWISSLAAACVLIIGGFLFFQNSNNDLYDLPIINSEIVRGAEQNITYEEAVKLFNKKSYRESREIFNLLLQQDPNQIQFKYYIGLSFIGEKNWVESINALDVISSGHSVFADEAKYYQAIALFKNGNNQSAINLLEKISSKGSLAVKREALLKEIK